MKLFSTSLLITFGLTAASAFAHQSADALPGRRLVELSPGEIRWTTEAERNALSEAAHAEGRCGGYIDITDHPRTYALRSLSVIDYTSLAMNQRTEVERLLTQVDSTRLQSLVQTLSTYRNRYYESATGVASAEWIANQYRTIAAGRSDIRVEKIAHRFAQPSVLVTWTGNGPQSNEIVLVGGHIDSINQSAFFNPNNAIAPGADDNASGTATVLETFRILVEGGFRPNRTLVFAGYAGEEKGLLGSQDIAESFRTQKKKVVGVVQFDMTSFPGSDPAITFMTDYTDAGFTDYLTRVVDTYAQIPWKKDRCGYGCSDHASWNRAGYPAAMPFETTMRGMNPNIHTPRDTLDRLDFGHGSQYVRLGVAYMVELSAVTTPLAL